MKMWWILFVTSFLSIFPRTKGLNFVTETFTTFFTASKEIGQLELTLGASSPKRASLGHKKVSLPLAMFGCAFSRRPRSRLILASFQTPVANTRKTLTSLISGSRPFLGSGRGTVGKCTGPKWSKRPFWSKCPYSELDFSIRETKKDQNGPFWPEEVHLGPFRSANRTLAIPDFWPSFPTDC